MLFTMRAVKRRENQIIKIMEVSLDAEQI